jgi:hypothetical protein
MHYPRVTLSIFATGPVGLKVMMEATATSGPMLRWVKDMLDAQKDEIYLARSSAYDADGKLVPSARRVLDTYRMQLSRDAFSCELRPCFGPRPRSYIQVRPDKVYLLVIVALSHSALL